MNHPFKVGQTYENMKGSFTILSISPPKMHIRYEDGSEATADIAIQGRIWERIEYERALARQEYERQARISRPTIAFSGLGEGDFKSNVAGTNWRSREGLAGLVSQQLSDLSGMDFTAWAIYRRPQFFVYPPTLPMYSQAEGVKLPKFIVQLDSESVLCGLYIEKSDTYMGSEWYWPRFLKLLSEPQWQAELEQAMKEHQLSWILRFEEKIDGTDAYRLSADNVVSSFGEGSQFPDFAAFVSYLHALPAWQWCNLFLARVMDKQEAIALQAKISQPLSHTLNSLFPFFRQLLIRAGNIPVNP